MKRHSTNPWVVLVLICFAQFMVVLDATVVNVALPSIQTDLGVSEANLQWVVNAYTLVFGGFLLLGGRAGDLLGRKRLFLGGVIVFTAASLLDGLSTSTGMLIGARALQGLGAAFISPAALAIISTTFKEGADRAKALGVWAAIAIGGSAVGLVLGGALTQAFSWPWIFYINVPVGIATFLFSMRLVPESRDETAHRSFDIPGAVTVTGGLMTLVYAIVQTETKGWTSTQTLVTFLIAVALLVAFVVIELRAKAPLVRLSIFRVRSLSAANVVMFLVGSGLFAMFFFNSLYIQRVLGYGPLKAGLAFLPFTAGIMVSATLASQFGPKVGIRITTAIGMVVATAGLLLLTRMPVNGSYLTSVLPSLLLVALGMGAVFVTLTLVATTGLEDDDQGLASGLFNTSQQVGGALGLAILSTIAASHTKGNSPAQLVRGFHWAFAGSAVFVLAGLVALVTMLRQRDVARIEAQAEEGQAVTLAA
ncbi:MAG: drug resistance transporter, EmrB/QacA subfamily [Actinomycetia bacterium]|jgi:EmrB/QacA subfamily drug resistance transporter|nr:drug resistance transporter, EmrB/QacA subfamily [Actinomycetes bacterium]